jgi:hypothetical protein
VALLPTIVAALPVYRIYSEMPHFFMDPQQCRQVCFSLKWSDPRTRKIISGECSAKKQRTGLLNHLPLP